MSCSRCGSDRLYQFEAAQGVELAAPLPLVCRQCGQISVGGVVVALPEALESQAMSMAESAAEAGSKTRLELEKDDPQEIRIEKYFANVYQKAYLDGFFRCLAFYKHELKEGRATRLRELWSRGECMSRLSHYPEWNAMGRVFTPEAYTEFEQLLNLSAAPEKPNAQSPANKHQTNEEGTPRVP
jgi:hypothetical protein